MAQLAVNLQRATQMPVWDKTGLSGDYYFAFRFAPEISADQQADAPLLTTALQESLGLRLEKQKGPVETLEIDHIEVPTRN
jgi:uncharacterized protein (TIGR03435 family)